MVDCKTRTQTHMYVQKRYANLIRNERVFETYLQGTCESSKSMQESISMLLMD